MRNNRTKKLAEDLERDLAVMVFNIWKFTAAKAGFGEPDEKIMEQESKLVAEGIMENREQIIENLHQMEVLVSEEKVNPIGCGTEKKSCGK